MQAITATYYGPTNFRGARIRVKAGAGVIWYPYDYEGSTSECMEACIRDYCDKKGWDLKLHFGYLTNGSCVGVMEK